MIFILLLSAIFLILSGIFHLKRFQLYGLLTTLIFTVLSIELLMDIDGLTLGVLTALTILSLPPKRIKVFDIIGCALIALPCIFWLGTPEFIDGWEYSHIFVALGTAIACNLLFDKQKRQTLCALVLLTSFVLCAILNAHFNVIDIALAFLIAIIFTTNYTLSFDLMTIDSYGTSL